MNRLLAVVTVGFALSAPVAWGQDESNEKAGIEADSRSALQGIFEETDLPDPILLEFCVWLVSQNPLLGFVASEDPLLFLLIAASILDGFAQEEGEVAPHELAHVVQQRADAADKKLTMLDERASARESNWTIAIDKPQTREKKGVNAVNVKLSRMSDGTTGFNKLHKLTRMSDGTIALDKPQTRDTFALASADAFSKKNMRITGPVLDLERIASPDTNGQDKIAGQENYWIRARAASPNTNGQDKIAGQKNYWIRANHYGINEEGIKSLAKPGSAISSIQNTRAAKEMKDSVIQNIGR